MRKKTLGIIGGVVLVAALGTASFFLLKNPPAEESSSSAVSDEDSSESISLTSEDPNDVTSIDITNTSGSFEVVRTAEGSGTGDDHAAYAVSGWEDLPMDTSTLWTLSNNTASMDTTGVVEENCSDLAKFGLDDAEATAVTLHFADGSDYSFRVGNAAANTENTYLAPADKDTVYMVKTSLVANFSKSAEDFLSKTMLEAPADTNDYPIVNKLTIDRKDMDYTLELDYDEAAADDTSMGGTVASHEMVSPVPAYLSVDRSTPVVTGMFGLKAEKVAVPHPSAEDIAKAGLDDPFGTATMACEDNNTYVLTFGERFTEKDEETGTETAYYYAMLSGVDAIYQVTEENMVWATTTPTDIASKLVFGTYVWDVGELNVSVGEEKFQFNVVGSDKDTAVVTLNGDSTESDRYRQFYSFLLNTTAETVKLDGTPSGDMLAEISLKTQDGTFERDLQFYAIDDFTCLITVDGKSAYTCRKSYLDTLLNNMKIYSDTSKEFTTNWS